MESVLEKRLVWIISIRNDLNIDDVGVNYDFSARRLLLGVARRYALIPTI